MLRGFQGFDLLAKSRFDDEFFLSLSGRTSSFPSLRPMLLCGACISSLLLYRVLFTSEFKGVTLSIDYRYSFEALRSHEGRTDYLAAENTFFLGDHI